MSQSIHINLDGGDVPLSLLPAGSDPSTAIVRCDDAAVEVALLDAGMQSGAHSVAIFARLPDGKLAMIEMSAKSLLNVAGAVRGRLIYKGVISEDTNPAIAFFADNQAKLIRFTTETPLQSWSYTVDHAKRFWRLLKQFAEDIS